jgi:hypothetical protein
LRTRYIFAYPKSEVCFMKVSGGALAIMTHPNSSIEAYRDYGHSGASLASTRQAQQKVSQIICSLEILGTTPWTGCDRLAPSKNR